MAKLPRVTNKIFANNATPANIGQFGSALSGSKVETSDIAEIQALPAFEQGWEAAVISDRNYPTLQEMNGVQKVFSQQQAYLFQEGIPEYDPNTTYFIGSVVKNLNEQNEPENYFSLTDGNIGNPLSDTNNWKKSGNANTDLSNLSSIGEKHFLNKTQISNCILEAPHMVDLELNDGTLTLKAGSKVIVPYGKQAPTMAIGDTLNGGTIVDISWDETNELLFYIVEYDNKDFSNTTSNATKSPIFINSAGNISSVIVALSGSTYPTTLSKNYTLFYNTTENIVRNYYGSIDNYADYDSFSFCITTRVTGTGITSIDETFQHIGYIGTIIWAMKGIKGLVVDGINPDGTANNIEFTTPTIITAPINTQNKNAFKFVVDKNNKVGLSYLRFDYWTYDISSNYFKGNSGEIQTRCTYLGMMQRDETTFTTFNVPYPFQATNTQDIDGNWIAKNTTLASNVTLSNTAATSYSLSSYLPNDGRTYEVLFSFAYTGDNSVSAQYTINSGFGTTWFLFNYSRNDALTTILPISTARKITITPNTNMTSGTNTFAIKLTAYRKVR